MAVDKSAKTRWEKSNVSFCNYQKYIYVKSNRFELTYIDLLFVSNFKGGNGAIHEEVEGVDNKLKFYSKVLKKIYRKFDSRPLVDLNQEEKENLKAELEQACALTWKESASKIDGFGVSYLSALLASYFPRLIPILDRRVLINSTLVKKNNLNTQNQVKEIHRFYGCLISYMFGELLAKPNTQIRDIDKALFTSKLPDWVNK